jgi:hypothetical protein
LFVTTITVTIASGRPTKRKIQEIHPYHNEEGRSVDGGNKFHGLAGGSRMHFYYYYYYYCYYCY